MVVRKDIDNATAVITVTITREDLKPKLNEELKRFRQRANIKGFRQGQAPAEFVKRMFGSSIFGDVLNDMLSRELFDYLREQKLDVLGQPMPMESDRKFGYKFDNPDPEYVVEYEVGHVPTFDLQGIDKKQTFERLTISNLEQLAEDDLEYARKRMGKRTNPETDIQENDIIKIASRELDGKKVKDGGWETTITVFLKNVADETLKNKLLSLKKGDTLQFNARSIENHEKEEMYRKYILNLEDSDDRKVGDMFEGTIEEVSRVDVADLDGEFYEKYFGGNVSSKDEAIDTIKKGIEQFYETRSNALLLRAFQDRLMDLNPIELPEAFLKRWLRATNEKQLNEDQMNSEYPAFADSLRWSLIRDKIKEDFAVEVTDADVYNEFSNRVKNYFQMELPEELIRSSVERLMKNEKDVENTKRDLESDKLFEAIRSQVTVVDKPIPSEEFHKILDAATGKNTAEEVTG